MSDDMKNIYKAYAKTIKPSEGYKEKLIQSMEAVKKPKKNRGIRYGVLAAGVCLAVGASLFVYGGRKQMNNGSKGTTWEMVSYGNKSDGYHIQKTLEGPDGEDFAVSDAQWMPGVVAKKIKDNLLVLEYDSDADFTHSKVADEAMVSALCEEIVSAKEIRQGSDSLLSDGECIYYRALFCDGTVIRFCIVNGTELVMEDKEVYHMDINNP